MTDLYFISVCRDIRLQYANVTSPSINRYLSKVMTNDMYRFKVSLEDSNETMLSEVLSEIYPIHILNYVVPFSISIYDLLINFKDQSRDVNVDGHLVINLSIDDEKFANHIISNMTNKESLKTIYELNPNNSHLAHLCVKQGMEFKHLIPKFKKDKDITLTAIRKSGIDVDTIRNPYFKFSGDRDVMLNVIFKYPLEFSNCDIELRSDFAFVMEAVHYAKTQNRILDLRCVGINLRSNETVVEEFIDMNVTNFIYASNSLKNDVSFVRNMCTINSKVYRFANDNVRNDKDIIKWAASINPRLLYQESEDVRNNKEIIMSTFMKDKEIFKNLVTDLTNDYRFMEKCVAKHVSVYRYCSERLRCNKKFTLNVVKIDGLMIEHAHIDLKNDREVATIAILSNKLASKFINDDVVKLNRCCIVI